MTEDSTYVQPTSAEVVSATTDVLAEDGYTHEDGQRNLNALRDAIHAAVSAARVTAKKERSKKALLRSRLMEVVLPGLPKSDAWPDADNPLLAEAVYKECSRIVWEQTTPTGPIQRRVGEADNGDFLCRCKITDDKLDALYVSSDLGCVEQDLFIPADRRMISAAKTRSVLGVLLVERQPENAEKSLSLYQRAGSLALASGETPIQMALEVAINGDEPEDEDEGDE